MCKAKNKGGMGFRDIHCFNLALLAKQGWRLLREPQSLLATILRAKYHPNSNFLDARLGHNPSFTWRSIMSGKEILKEGLTWTIGNGASSRVWEDK